MSASVDPIVLAALCGLLGSLAIMLSITLRRPPPARARAKRNVPVHEPTVRMNALDLEALEETLPAPSQGSPGQQVHELSILTQSQASRLVGTLAVELPPPSDADVPKPPSSAPVLLTRPSRRFPASSVDTGRLPDLRFEDGEDDAPTRLDDNPLFTDPAIPPPGRLPTDLVISTPPPVPPAPVGQAPSPLPIYRRSGRLRAGGSGTVPKGSAQEAAEPSSDRPASSQPPSFAYGDRSRRA